MELKRIRINNFRSIKDVTIEIDEINNSKCLILLGKNEAGKSNILKAISAVFGNYKVSSKDQRKEQSGENIKSDDYYIHAIFTLNDDDFIKIEENFKNTYQNTDLINFTDNQTILDLIKDCFKEILLHIDIDNNKEAEMHFWTYENEKINFNQSISLKEKIFQICENGEKSLIIKDLVSKIFGCICEIWNLKEMYICHNWQYKEEYILPSYVNIENFKNDPDICIPLKNVFILGGKTDIKSSFEKVLKQDNNIYNLLDNVSKEATKKIKHMWSDLDEIKISLLPNGDNIQIFIEDHIKFHMEDRSDGFKRFISMLLTLSCEKDKNKIFIIDEPDAFLYPTSAKNLRKELINLGKDSLIIYSTHSPFMIDNNALEHNNRHLIVEKKNGITSIVRENLTKANYLKDELILKAIGTTIFDKIKDKNILFEGYTDYKLFHKFKNSKFSKYGSLYICGITDIDKIIPMIILTNTKFIVVADSDNASNDKFEDFQKKFPNYKDNWLKYSDIASNDNIETLEDFYKQDYVENTMNENGYNDFSFKKEQSTISNIKHCIDLKIKNDEKNEKELKKDKIREIKKQLAESAKKENIKESYFKFLELLKNSLEEL